MSNKIVYRDCINWSNNDHCAKTKCNYCTKDCRDYRKLGEITETRNALAELEEIVRDTKSDFYTTAISKAQRIIDELAKVEYGDDGHIRYWTDIEIKLKKCRAIAEEGAGDGFKRD